MLADILRFPNAILGTATLGFLYYTFWLFVTPFIPDDHIIQSYFPDREIGVATPLVLMAIVFFSLTAFIGVVMMSPENRFAPVPPKCKED